jgi:hypothetical protein
MKTNAFQITLNVLLVLTLLSVSCTAVISSKTITPAPTATIDIDVLRSDPNYMARCLELNSDVYPSQVGYKGIYPGQTRDNEVRQLVGEPLKINNQVDISWEYDGFVVLFDKNLVTWIVVYNGEILNDTLQNSIHKYGCPDAIYALDINEHPSGDYSRLLFIYHNVGVYFIIDKIPAELSDKIEEISYFVPGTLEEYLKRFEMLLIPDATKPLTWDEAVK